ncbi:surfeit locus protein 1 [Alcanivorax balearicus MACL04]|uniref:SURF1-like protein n=1 Tax=Alloalcanivorax balearicus MACL04 TaxID=1177182 RepID=A0ABT2QUH1_9GAMM|nr:SURF1 family protein [Alloalcanivorax balearicus]MCU5781172.1 surfeit locus protein 1 [Alloalcanivorax balearicus MACL04]
MNRPPRPGSNVSRLRRAARLAWVLVAVAAFIGLVSLGNWQVERRAWKLDLIERVSHRVDAPAEPAPGPAEWPRISREQHEYRHVQLSGTFLADRVSLVQASTELGSGYWVMTPLKRDDGTVVLINRGYVPQQQRDRAAAGAWTPEGKVRVSGLLRLSEPGGGFLRDNVPAESRWYSRDVAAIARTHDLTRVAPYFVDADAGPAPAEGPVGGLTVVSFHNNHLVYAITWYTLALMVAAGAVFVLREELRSRR